MTKEEWIKRAKEIIQSNEEFIAEVDFMVRSDWTRHKSRRESAINENKFLEQGIKLVSN